MNVQGNTGPLPGDRAATCPDVAVGAATALVVAMLCMLLAHGTAYAVGNVGYVWQAGDGNVVLVDQTGFENVAGIMQGPADPLGGNYNLALVLQDGVDQSLWAWQDGDFNWLSALQLGFDNTALLWQWGAYNSIWLAQYGEGHLARIWQDGYGQDLLVVQLGSHKELTIRHHGGAQLTVMQFGF